MNSCLRQSLSKNESLLIIYLWRRKCSKIMKNTREVIGNIFEVLFGLSELPVLSIPLDLHANSLLSTAIISLGCTGLQKIARLTTEHRLPAIKIHKKRCGHDFFWNRKSMKTFQNIMSLEGFRRTWKVEVAMFPFLKDRTRTHFCLDLFWIFKNVKPTPVSRGVP